MQPWEALASAKFWVQTTTEDDPLAFKRGEGGAAKARIV